MAFNFPHKTADQLNWFLSVMRRGGACRLLKLNKLHIDKAQIHNLKKNEIAYLCLLLPSKHYVAQLNKLQRVFSLIISPLSRTSQRIWTNHSFFAIAQSGHDFQEAIVIQQMGQFQILGYQDINIVFPGITFGLLRLTTNSHKFFISGKSS